MQTYELTSSSVITEVECLLGKWVGFPQLNESSNMYSGSLGGFAVRFLKKMFAHCSIQDIYYATQPASL